MFLNCQPLQPGPNLPENIYVTIVTIAPTRNIVSKSTGEEMFVLV